MTAPVPVFAQGSLLRHILRMTVSGTIGLIAIFFVDFLSLLYVSWLGDPAKTAGVGFAAQVLFLAMSINIGMAIAVAATVARAIGEGRMARARSLAGSGLTLAAAAGLVVSAPMFFARGPILALFGATGEARAVADAFLAIVAPTNMLMALGMAAQGLLRAFGDARRSMMVTLWGAAATALLDPALIFGLGLGPTGAALATALSRFVFVGVGLWSVARVHHGAQRPTAARLRHDGATVLAIAAPAILTNLATPVATAYAMRIYAQFGEPIVAGVSIIDRVSPVAFGALFALTGAVGPILAQNQGAGLYGRVQRTLSLCVLLTIAYVAVMWGALALTGPSIADVFRATGETRAFVVFFCSWGVVAWMFLGLLFVANTAFNNLGYPLLSTAFNWGRTLLGVAPFVTWGARWYGPEGAMMGVAAGAAVFGIAAAGAAFWVVARRARRGTNTS